MYVDLLDTFLGKLEIVADERTLLEIRLVDAPQEVAPNHITDSAKAWLRSYFAKEPPSWMPPLRFRTTFSQKVSEAVMEVPFSKTASYGQIARAIGRPTAYRAVAQVMKHNPYMILVPCHRIVAKNSLGGYNGGIEIKKRLLEFEGAYR